MNLGASFLPESRIEPGDYVTTEHPRTERALFEQR